MLAPSCADDTDRHASDRASLPATPPTQQNAQSNENDGAGVQCSKTVPARVLVVGGMQEVHTVVNIIYCWTRVFLFIDRNNASTVNSDNMYRVMKKQNRQFIYVSYEISG